MWRMRVAFRNRFVTRLGDHRFSGDQQSRDRGGALQSGAHYFGWVNDALAQEIAEFTGLGVEAVGVDVLLEDLADHDRTVLA